ncbi:beta-Ig-H3/fasciclin [Streptomyces bobili]|uniref:beta-Ig-H3/fasciclin n=1 Tax=Streptomyces bobili TaxID=67280 RepID=UPI003413A336
MRMSRRAVQAVVTAAAIGGSMIISATPAAAATTAPSCISRLVTERTDGFDVLLTNRCRYERAAKIEVSLAPDSSCYVIPSGSNAFYIYKGIFGNYSRTVNC